MKKIKKCISVLMATSMLAIGPQMVWADVDANTITNVQQSLNNAGYDCGTPDGIAGAGTQGAIKKYQEDNGLNISGNIDDELLSSLELDSTAVGVSLSTFVSRYNEATDYYNAIAERDGYSKANYVSEDMFKNSDSESPNNNIKVCVNPNTTNKENVGIINIFAEDKSVLDANVATGEIMAMIYAFDASMTDCAQALNTWGELNANVNLKQNGLTYSNFSDSKMLMIRGQDDGYEIENESDKSTGKTIEEKKSDEKSSDEKSTNTKSKYAHESYEIDISKDDIVDAFNIMDSKKLTNITELVGVKAYDFAEETGVTFNNEHRYESSNEVNIYKYKSVLGNYTGYISVPVDKKTDEIKSISFGLQEDIKPIPRETMLETINELSGKNPYKSIESFNISDYWMIGNCKVELLSYDLEDDMYQGVQFVRFTEQN